jgi:GntR family transcriptional repressor for pyruvate dehydrogenase complex
MELQHGGSSVSCVVVLRSTPLSGRTEQGLSRTLEDTLERLIATEAVPRGSRLPSERELAEQYTVSRAVVRDALRALAVRGLIEVRRGVGAIVIDGARRSVGDILGTALRVNSYSVPELLIARSVLETEVAGLAAENRTAEDVSELKNALDSMRVATESREVEAAMDAHERFHVRLTLATRNRVLEDFVAPLTAQALATAAAAMEGSWLDTNDLWVHEAIFRFVAAGDREGARSAMSVHARTVEHELERERDS